MNYTPGSRSQRHIRPSDPAPGDGDSNRIRQHVPARTGGEEEHPAGETVEGEVVSMELMPMLDPRQTLALQLRDPVKRDMLWQMYPTMSQLDMDVLEEKCRATGLNPWMNEIYPIERGQGDKRKVTYQTSIEGYRKIAFSSGQYDGMEGPWWCGADGVWKDIWLEDTPPLAAKVTMYRKDIARPFTSVALWKEYVQTTIIWGERKGEKIGTRVTDMWETKGASMLAKCAESLNYRKMSPNLFGGVYTAEEMGQADNYVTVEPMPTLPAVAAPAAAARRDALGKSAAKAETNAQAREQQARQHNEAPPDEAPPPVEAPKAASQLTDEQIMERLPVWMHPIFVLLKSQDKSLKDLAPILGRAVTMTALRDWGAALEDPAPLPNGEPADVEDPYAVMITALYKHGIITNDDITKVIEESQPTTTQAVDPATGELFTVAGPDVPDGLVPVDDDDLPFE